MADGGHGPAPVFEGKFAWTHANAKEASRIIALYPEGRQASAVMPLLWLAQGQMAEATGSAWLPCADSGPVLTAQPAAPFRSTPAQTAR